MTKPQKSRHLTVNLDRLDAATGQWRITTGSASDPLPRAVATDPAVRAAIVAWMAGHRARQQPTPDASEQLTQAIRTSVTTALQALPPAPAVKTPAPVVSRREVGAQRSAL